MAEAKAEVMEEIEDGRDEGEEEDSVDATTSVSPRRTGAGDVGAPRRPWLLWEGPGRHRQESCLCLRSLETTGSHVTRQGGQGEAAGRVGQIVSVSRKDQDSPQAGSGHGPPAFPPQWLTHENECVFSVLRGPHRLRGSGHPRPRPARAPKGPWRIRNPEAAAAFGWI